MTLSLDLPKSGSIRGIRGQETLFKGYFHNETNEILEDI